MEAMIVAKTQSLEFLKGFLGNAHIITILIFLKGSGDPLKELR